jgi:DNA-binding IclR family transcriptional regulator
MKKVRSVSKAFRILEFFQAGKSHSISDFSRGLRFPKSSVYEILTTLAEEGVVERDDHSGRYRLGLKLIELGSRARHQFPLNRIAAPFLRALSQQFDETVNLAVRDRDEIFYVDCYESSRVLRTYSTTGDRAPLYCTGVGKAILAFLPEAERERILGALALQRHTPNTITDPALLREELRRTVERGYSVDDMEHEDGVRCVGAPLRNAEGRVFASISVSGPAQRITVEREAQFAERVTAAAREVSRSLGCSIGDSEMPPGA